MQIFPLLVCFLPLLSLSSSVSIYDSFLHCLSNHSNPSSPISSLLFPQTHPSYSSVLQSYVRNRRFNRSTTPKPLLIFTANQQSHVQAAVICAKNANIQLKIRSGGHDFEGLSYVSATPYILLDMFNLRSINVDVGTETAWVQAGATLGELYYRIWEKSRVHAFAGGVCPTVGVGGHISGGGYGNLMRKYGLAVDNIADAEIIDVNGRILNRASMGEDLFWAIRGGGGASFGVILAYKVKLIGVPERVSVFQIWKTLEQNLTEVLVKYQYVADKIDRDLFLRLSLEPVSITQKGVKTIGASFQGMFLGDCLRLVSVMTQGIPELGLKREDCKEMSWVESAIQWANLNPSNVKTAEVLLNRTSKSLQFQKRKSDYVQNPISRNGLEQIWKKMIEVGNIIMVFNPYGGRMGEIQQWETPFPHRAGNIFKIQYTVNWKEESTEAESNYVNKLRMFYSFMTPYVSNSPRAAFLNYRDLDIGINHNGKNSYNEGSVYGVKYFKKNFDRLVKVKTAVDPGNFFRDEQSIPVLPSWRKNRNK